MVGMKYEGTCPTVQELKMLVDKLADDPWVNLDYATTSRIRTSGYIEEMEVSFKVSYPIKEESLNCKKENANG